MHSGLVIWLRLPAFTVAVWFLNGWGGRANPMPPSDYPSKCQMALKGAECSMPGNFFRDRVDIRLDIRRSARQRRSSGANGRKIAKLTVPERRAASTDAPGVSLGSADLRWGIREPIGEIDLRYSGKATAGYETALFVFAGKVRAASQSVDSRSGQRRGGSTSS
jgi:hypothetical protein